MTQIKQKLAMIQAALKTLQKGMMLIVQSVRSGTNQQKFKTLKLKTKGFKFNRDDIYDE